MDGWQVDKVTWIKGQYFIHHARESAPPQQSFVIKTYGKFRPWSAGLRPGKLAARHPIGVGMRDLTSPLPPNRTGGSPASGSPVSGFVVVRLYVSMHVPPPRTAAHAGQTLRSASGDGPSPALSRHHPAAIAADCATVVSHSHPHFGTCSVCCAGNTHTSPAKSGSLPSRFPSGYARPAATSSSAPVPSTSAGSSCAAISCPARSDTRGSQIHPVGRR